MMRAAFADDGVSDSDTVGTPAMEVSGLDDL